MVLAAYQSPFLDTSFRARPPRQASDVNLLTALASSERCILLVRPPQPANACNSSGASPSRLRFVRCKVSGHSLTQNMAMPLTSPLTTVTLMFLVGLDWAAVSEPFALVLFLCCESQ